MDYESKSIKLETNEECKFNNQTNHLELEDNSSVINNVVLSVPTNVDFIDPDAKGILDSYQNYEKMKTEEKICRFCFKMCCNFKTVDGDIKYISDVLLPGIELSAIQDPVLCIHCEEILFMSFDFKTRCLCTQDYLIPFVNKTDDGVKLNLKDIYMSRFKNSILEDQNICGFCMCPVKDCSAIFLEVGERGVVLRKTIGQCLPEVNLSVIEEPVICASCHASLENHYRFVTNVLIGEGKITKYRESLDIISNSPIGLSSLLQFILSEVEGNDGYVIKFEKMSCDRNESVDQEVEHKCNAMDIDELKFNNEEKFTSTSMLNCEIENSGIGAIKSKETFCAETEFKEKNVEVEDQKILFDEKIEIKTDELDLNSFEDGIVMAQPNTRISGKQECSLLPNFVDNLFKRHIEQTCINNLVPEIITHPYECAPFKSANKQHQKTSEVTMYKCDSCAYQARRKGDIKRHLLKHKDITEVTMYKCDSCFYQTKYKSQLQRHLLKHKSPSEVTMYQCDLCLYETKYKAQLKNHFLKHKSPSEVTMYTCDFCSHKTKYKSQLKRHLLKHMNPSDVTIHKCDSCAYQTICKSNLTKHLLKHKDISEVTMFKCDVCSYKSKYKSHLKTHLLKHNPPDGTMHKCGSCTYQTIDEYDLKKHLYMDCKDPLEVAMHKCDSCAYQTIRKASLKLHLLKHKDISEVTMHRCDLCLYQTKYKSLLTRHLLKHKSPSEITMYKCDSCAYRTIRKNNLTTHLLTHKDISEVTVHKCASCSFQTKYKSKLKKHLLVHKNPSEVTMHKCDLCVYQTKRKYDLKNHLLKHKNISEVTMFKCPSCLFQTKYKSGLKTHLLMHKNSSGVTMHKCDSCTYQTIYKRDLQRHFLKHDGDSNVTIYKCNSCLYRTKHKRYLTRHVLTHKGSFQMTVY